ncbi:DegV family protein [Adlercreutzia faecimuris]|uniref:DegV family protein n=1 Tax=Adlercreutzia faecimuris TaxID=2897341 RepID=A0ABS9WG19_9ACTN|nr:DegV family protein [Adlercreutzia sp. JBNU-10]MCI2241812.1 DegV family protein [Adlercreutzia sp. JBNU-10]
MPKCNLIIDSCCDLPPELVDRDGVYLLKFPYIMDGEPLDDDLFRTRTAADFYGAMREGAEPSTSQVSIPALTEAFEAAAASGVPTVYLCFSSGLSGSYDAAVLVRDQVAAAHPDAELYVVDTHLASIAEGLLVYEALEQRAKGLTAEEMVRWAEEARYFVNEKFMVEDLDALRRGGRIPGSVAVAGAALDVKPLLVIAADGTLSLSGVARGRKKGLRALVDFYAKHAAPAGSAQCVLVGHADAPKDAARLKDLLLKENDSILVLECNIGPVIGSHVGPGMVAAVFWGGDKRDELSVADRIARKVKGVS